jgi:hypothetical protein
LTKSFGAQQAKRLPKKNVINFHFLFRIVSGLMNKLLSLFRTIDGTMMQIAVDRLILSNITAITTETKIVTNKIKNNIKQSF